MDAFDHKSGQKRIFIKDPVWGNIELFPWEKTLLNENLINRLHHIVQVSSGFRVYPGLRHTRFLHSIGVLYVVTNTFSNAVRNTPHAIKQNKNDERKAANYRKALEQFKAENAALNALFLKEAGADFLKELEAYNQGLGLSGDTYLTLCVLRIAAILHDVGHMPYSHLLETVITAVIDDSKQLSETSTQSLTADIIAKCKNIETGLKDLHDTHLHECLGQQISLLLETRFRISEYKLLQCLIHCASEILHADKFPLLKSLLIGAVDADRIDYVKRDGYFSGLYQSSVDYGRLFSAYEFAYHPEDIYTKEIYFSKPAPQASSEAEKLVFERFLLYKNVISHHRVHLFDEILLRILRILICNGTLVDFLDGIVRLLRLKRHSLGKQLQSIRWNATGDLAKIDSNLRYSFDDSWLDCEIRNAVNKSIAGALEEGNDSEPPLVFLYNATFEDRGLLRSFHKGRWGSFIDPSIERDLRELINTVDGEDTFAKIANISSKVSECKFELEIELLAVCDKLRFIIIGDMQHRLSVGINSEKMAELLNLENLLHFLREKHSETLPYNVWFALTDDFEQTLSEMEPTKAEAALGILLRNIGQKINSRISGNVFVSDELDLPSQE